MLNTLRAQPPKYETPEWNEYEAEVRAELEEKVGKDKVFNTSEAQARFKIHGFLAPYCTAEDRETGEQVVLAFIHSPRLYWLN